MRKVLRLRVYSVEEFKRLAFAPKAPAQGGKYSDTITSFDIEVSKNPFKDNSFMYVWQWAIENYGVVMGRTWQEYLDLQEYLESKCKEKGYKLVVYVHNLSFEWQYLRGILNAQDVEKVMCLDSRKVLSFRYKHMEYRCSYMLSNLSLAQWTRDMKVEHQKLKGDLDYSVTRYPGTPLTTKELRYCVNDVQGVVEAVRAELVEMGNTLDTIPKTATGYPRADMRKIAEDSGNGYRGLLKKMIVTEDEYKHLRWSFSGGYVHASRFYAGQVLHGVDSYDRSSSYPDVMVNCKFPVGRSRKLERGDGTIREGDIVRYMQSGKRFVIRVRFINLRLSDEFDPAPYISYSKVEESRHRASSKGFKCDNGRVMSAPECTTTVTDVDLRIILNHYDFDSIDFISGYWWNAAYLPDVVRNTVKAYYTDKTELKGVEGKEVYYAKRKAMLNSLYGMFAQDPAKEDIEYKDGEYVCKDSPLSKRLKGSQNPKTLYKTYVWAPWVTAFARQELFIAIEGVGGSFVYSDTDSVKALPNNADWESINERLRSRSIKNGGVATDPKGNIHYLGVFEKEYTALSFETLGCKRYMYTLMEHKKLKSGKKSKRLYPVDHITIAGVPKRAVEYLQTLANGCYEVCDGFIFPEEYGGTRVHYDDCNPHWETINGNEVYITSSATIYNTSKKLKLTPDYIDLIEMSQAAARNHNFVNSEVKYEY